METQSPLLAAVHVAARKLASSGNFEQLLKEVLSICVEAVGADGGTIYLHDRDKRCLVFRHVLPEEVAEKIQLSDIPDDHGVAGNVYQSRKTIISHFEQSRGGSIEDKTGVTVRTMITVPLVMEGEEPIGVVQLVNKKAGLFTDDDAMVLDTVSAVSTLAFLNQKLLEESTRASQLLGMGKVGHDIKNLAFALEANVSFTDDTIENLKTELESTHASASIVAHVDDLDIMFQELSSSIDRIKRYSMLMSDLSAGKQLQPTKRMAPLAATIQLAAAFLESEGRSRHVRLCYDIQQDAPALLHDEMYIFRIVQNLVSNAIKATGETEDNSTFESDDDESHWKMVTIRYRFDGGQHILEVEDRGPGMTEETANRILMGNARSLWGKSSGSGWGTKIVRELAMTHHGEMTIDSELGKGSTFRICFPTDQS